jgi:3-dehydrotetronate 4-kinase
MPLLGAIADDFTGATDLATMLVARGFRTVVTVGPPDPADLTGPSGEAGSGFEQDSGPVSDPDSGPDAGPDAVVVALKSRTAPVDEAVQQSLAALEALRAAGCERFYFKYCSTFDSTPKGNIGPVADALLDALGERRTIVVPAFPATGRTVYRARLFVHDALLDESPMRGHPLTPMRDSHLGRLLAPQTRRKLHYVGHDTVRAGADAVREALREPAAQKAITILDATSDADLRTIAAATDDFPLVTGAAGLALGLTGPHPDSARAPSTGDGPGVVLSGSASAATRAQVAHARDRLPHRRLDLRALREDFGAAVAELVSFARECWEKDPAQPPVIYAVAQESDVERRAPRGGADAATLAEQALSRCAAELVASGARHLLVAGGETSGAVVTALGARSLHIGNPIAPGVCWARADAHLDGRAHPVDLALKSGNFGGTDIFTTAWDAL